jgi:hypothetical protein
MAGVVERAVPSWCGGVEFRVLAVVQKVVIVHIYWPCIVRAFPRRPTGKALRDVVQSDPGFDVLLPCKWRSRAGKRDPCYFRNESSRIAGV